MSDSQTSATVERGRPTSRQEHPHFRYIRSVAYSAHEQAVLDAGYPWVRTNMLIPTWASPDADPRSNPVPDRLKWHGHHGVNTHLIVEGDITLMKLKKMFGQNHISAVTMSTDPGAPKEAPVAPDEVYTGTTQQACKFVEGHRNLSPMSAHRYVSRGSLEWVDEDGRAVRGTNRTYILQQLENAEFKTNFDFKVMRRVAACEFKDDNDMTWSMRQWFLREWNDPNVQAAKGDLRPAIHPLDAHLAPQQKNKEVEEVDSDEEYGSSGLIRRFKEWLLGSITED